MRRRVMVPLDGTEAIESVAGFLGAWPDRQGLEVLLVAVWQPSESFLGGDPWQRTFAPRVLACVTDNLRSYTRSLEARLRAQGLLARSLFLPGHPPQHLTELAEQEAVDLILTGPRGLAGPQCQRQPRPRWCSGPCPLPQ